MTALRCDHGVASHSACGLLRFWQCPNGKECKYKHKLPPGFQLKSEIKQMMADEAANKVSIEEEIETERRNVAAVTPVTPAVRSRPDYTHDIMPSRRANVWKGRLQVLAECGAKMPIMPAFGCQPAYTRDTRASGLT